MDFFQMNRKQLQGLCKKHQIPANSTNLVMATALASLLKEEQNPVVVSSGESDGTRKPKKVTFSFEINDSEKHLDLNIGDGKAGSRRRSILKPQHEISNPNVVGQISVRTTRSLVTKSGDGEVPLFDSLPVSVPVEKKNHNKQSGKGGLDETVGGVEKVSSLVPVPLPVEKKNKSTKGRNKGIDQVPQDLVQGGRSLRNRQVAQEDVVVDLKKKDVSPRRTRRGVVAEPKDTKPVEVDVSHKDGRPKRIGKKATQEDERSMDLDEINELPIVKEVDTTAPKQEKVTRRSKRNTSASEKGQGNCESTVVLVESNEIIQEDIKVAPKPEKIQRHSRRNNSTSGTEEANSEATVGLVESKEDPVMKEDTKTVPQADKVQRRSKRNASTFQTSASETESRSKDIHQECGTVLQIEDPMPVSRNSRASVTKATRGEHAAVQEESKVSELEFLQKQTGTRASKRKSIAPTECIANTDNNHGRNKFRKQAGRSLLEEAVSVPEVGLSANGYSCSISEVDQRPSRRSTRNAYNDSSLPVVDKKIKDDEPAERNKAVDEEDFPMVVRQQEKPSRRSRQNTTVDKSITLTTRVASSTMALEQTISTKAQKRRRETILPNEESKTEETIVLEENPRRLRRNGSRRQSVVVNERPAARLQTEKFEMDMKDSIVKEDIVASKNEMVAVEKEIIVGKGSDASKVHTKRRNRKGRGGKTVKKQAGTKVGDLEDNDVNVSSTKQTLSSVIEVSEDEHDVSASVDRRFLNHELEQIDEGPVQAVEMTSALFEVTGGITGTVCQGSGIDEDDEHTVSQDNQDGVTNVIDIREEIHGTLSVHKRPDEEVIPGVEEFHMVTGDGTSLAYGCNEAEEQPKDLESEATDVASTRNISEADCLSPVRKPDHTGYGSSQDFPTTESIKSGDGWLYVKEAKDQQVSDGSRCMDEIEEGNKYQESLCNVKDEMLNAGVDQSMLDAIVETTTSGKAFDDESPDSQSYETEKVDGVTTINSSLLSPNEPSSCELVEKATTSEGTVHSVPKTDEHTVPQDNQDEATNVDEHVASASVEDQSLNCESEQKVVETASALFDVTGGITGVVCQSRDIDEGDEATNVIDVQGEIHGNVSVQVRQDEEAIVGDEEFHMVSYDRTGLAHGCNEDIERLKQLERETTDVVTGGIDGTVCQSSDTDEGDEQTASQDNQDEASNVVDVGGEIRDTVSVLERLDGEAIIGDEEFHMVSDDGTIRGHGSNETEEQLKHLVKEANDVVSSGSIYEADCLSSILEPYHTDFVVNEEFPASENAKICDSWEAVKEVKDQKLSDGKKSRVELEEGNKDQECGPVDDQMVNAGADQSKLEDIVETNASWKAYVEETSDRQSNKIDQGDGVAATDRSYLSPTESSKFEESVDKTPRPEGIVLSILENDECAQLVQNVDVVGYKDAFETSEVRRQQDIEEKVTIVAKEKSDQDWEEECDVKVSVVVQENIGNANDIHGHLGVNGQLSTLQSSVLDIKASPDASTKRHDVLKEKISGDLSEDKVSVVLQRLHDDFNDFDKPLQSTSESHMSKVKSPSNKVTEDVTMLRRNFSTPVSKDGIVQPTGEEEKLNVEASFESTEKNWNSDVLEEISGDDASVVPQRLTDDLCDFGTSLRKAFSTPVSSDAVQNPSNIEVEVEENAKMLQRNICTPVSKATSNRVEDEEHISEAGCLFSIPQSSDRTDNVVSKEHSSSENTNSGDGLVDFKEVKDHRFSGRKGSLEELTEGENSTESGERVDDGMRNVEADQFKSDYLDTTTSAAFVKEHFDIESNDIDQADAFPITESIHPSPSAFSQCFSPQAVKDGMVEEPPTTQGIVRSIGKKVEVGHFQETVELSTQQYVECGYKDFKDFCDLDWQEERDSVGSVEIKRKKWDVTDEYGQLEDNAQVLTKQFSEVDSQSLDYTSEMKRQGVKTEPNVIKVTKEDSEQRSRKNLENNWNAGSLSEKVGSESSGDDTPVVTQSLTEDHSDYGISLQRTFTTPAHHGCNASIVEVEENVTIPQLSPESSPLVEKNGLVEKASTSKRTVPSICINDGYEQLELDFKVVNEASEVGRQEHTEGNVIMTENENLEKYGEAELDVDVSGQISQQKRKVNDELEQLCDNLPHGQSLELDIADCNNSIAIKSHDAAEPNLMNVKEERAVHNIEEKQNNEVASEIIRVCKVDDSVEEVNRKSSHGAGVVPHRLIQDLSGSGRSLHRPSNTPESQGYGPSNLVDEVNAETPQKSFEDLDDSDKLIFNEVIMERIPDHMPHISDGSPATEASRFHQTFNDFDENVDHVEVELEQQVPDELTKTGNRAIPETQVKDGQATPDLQHAHGEFVVSTCPKKSASVDLVPQGLSTRVKNTFYTPTSQACGKLENVATHQSSIKSLSDFGTTLHRAFCTPSSDAHHISMGEVDDTVASPQKSTEELLDFGSSLQSTFRTPHPKASCRSKVTCEEHVSLPQILSEDVSDFGSSLRKAFDTPSPSEVDQIETVRTEQNSLEECVDVGVVCDEVMYHIDRNDVHKVFSATSKSSEQFEHEMNELEDDLFFGGTFDFGQETKKAVETMKDMVQASNGDYNGNCGEESVCVSVEKGVDTSSLLEVATKELVRISDENRPAHTVSSEPIGKDLMGDNTSTDAQNFENLVDEKESGCPSVITGFPLPSSDLGDIGGVEHKCDDVNGNECSRLLSIVENDNDQGREDGDSVTCLRKLSAIEEAEDHALKTETVEEIDDLFTHMHLSTAAKKKKCTIGMTRNTPKKPFVSEMKENLLNIKMEHSATPYTVTKSVTRRRALEDLSAKK